MSTLGNSRGTLPIQGRLLFLVGIAVIMAAIFADLLLLALAIVPQWRTWQQLTDQKSAAQRALKEARESQAVAPEMLRSQIADAQAKLNKAVELFLSEAEATDALDRLYLYARESGVEIADMHAQPIEAQPDALYEAQTFQLRVVGDLRDLISFVSRIEETANEAFAITDVAITEGQPLHSLTMGITLYTSARSSEEPGQPEPDDEPEATPSRLAELREALTVAMAAQQWAGAIDAINRIRALDPSCDVSEAAYTAHVNYGNELLAAGDADAATVQFGLALVVRPEGAEAVAGLRQAAATPPPTLTAVQLLAQRLDGTWAAGDWEASISLIRQILALDPEAPGMTEKLYAAHVNYGHQLSAAGRLDEAKEQFTRALEVNPQGAEAAVALQDLAARTQP